MTKKQISIFRFISTISLTATLIITLLAYFQMDNIFTQVKIKTMNFRFQIFVVGIVISSFASFLITWRLILSIVVTKAEYRDNLDKKDLNKIIEEKKVQKEKEIDWKTIIVDDSQIILQRLCRVLKIDIGRKFDFKENRFINTANYSIIISDEDKINDAFELGIGINGQAAESMKPLLLKNIPDGYAKITSGSGSISPKNIYIIPIVVNGKTICLFELADMKKNGAITFDKLQKFANELVNTKERADGK